MSDPPCHRRRQKRSLPVGVVFVHLRPKPLPGQPSLDDTPQHRHPFLNLLCPGCGHPHPPRPPLPMRRDVHPIQHEHVEVHVQPQ